MAHPNLEIINRFFQAYSQRDTESIAAVTTEDITWHFPGRHPLAGTKRGREEVVAFFDLMAAFGFRAERLIIGVNDDFVIESHQVVADQDGDAIELGWCVLWSFSDGKLSAGKHYSDDQHKADDFFNRLWASNAQG